MASVKHAIIFCLPSPQFGWDSTNFQERVEFNMQTSAQAKGWFSKSKEARGPRFGRPADGLRKTVPGRNVYNLFCVLRFPSTKQKSSSVFVVFASRLPGAANLLFPTNKNMNKMASVKKAFIFCLPSPQCGWGSANFQERIEFKMQTFAQAEGWFSKSKEARGPCFGQPEDGLPKTVSGRNVSNFTCVYPTLEIGAFRRIPRT